jgi:hypothetical protein
VEIGLIVEGDYDVKALKRLVERINTQPVDVHPLPCNGPVTKKFTKLLYAYEYVTPVQKAVVISDAHGRDPAELIEGLRGEMQGHHFSFPVEFAVVVQELEAWLIADHQAIQQVSNQRGNQRVVPPTKASPENLFDAKAALQKLLSIHGVDYTAVVAEEIAENARLEQLRYWCRSFVVFEPIVKNC